MIEKLKHKYALSEKGAKDMVRAFVAVTLANLALMVPVGLLYVLASCLLDGSLPKEKLPFFIIGIIAALLLIIVTTYFQYNSTFMATYVESGVRRRTLAEKLRKLPLSFFGKKDLSDLTQYYYVRLCIARNSQFPLDSGTCRCIFIHNNYCHQPVCI